MLTLAGLAVATSCSIDAAGTADDSNDGADGDVDSGDLDGALEGGAPDTCAPKNGQVCTSPAKCTSGVVQCDGACSAAADPPKLGTACTTSKGCAGKIGCSGCEGEPLATGDPCTTAHGCGGKKTCDGSCAGELPGVGGPCPTAKGCSSIAACDGSCPESPAVGKPCTSLRGCALSTACDGSCLDVVAGKACTSSKGCAGTSSCDGSCPDPASVGEACTTTKGCAAVKGCDGKCAADAPAVGTPCTTLNGCGSTIGCDLKCLPDAPTVGLTCTVGACTNGKIDCTGVCKSRGGAACTSATCHTPQTTDCLGACPDPLAADRGLPCMVCYCAGVLKGYAFDACGVCPVSSCASVAGCADPDAGSIGDASDASSDAPWGG